MAADRPDIDTVLLKARIAMGNGRMDDGIEELRQGLFDAAKRDPVTGRRQAEQILNFAMDHSVFEEVEDILESESLGPHFFGHE